jgi:hypothetical protein
MWTIDIKPNNWIKYAVHMIKELRRKETNLSAHLP